jgi:hypothetical protein
MTDIGSVDHHSAKQRELRKRRANESERMAKQPPVERQRLQRAPRHSRAFKFGAIVRMTNIGAKFYLGMVFQDFDRFGAGLQEGRAQRGVRPISYDLPQISLDVRGAVGRRDIRCMTRIRYPDRSRRQRRRSPKKFGFLDQQRLGVSERKRAADMPAVPP